MKRITKLAILVSVFFTGFACSKSNDGGSGGGGLDCNTVTNKAFTADVNPIIQSTCAVSGCHDALSTNGPGALTNYSQVFAARASIESSVSAGRMPKTGSLSTGQKNSIICWVQSGAPNN